MAKDLATIKKLAEVLENEAAELRKLPENLPEPKNLPRSQGGELPDEPKKEGESEAEKDETKNGDQEKQDTKKDRGNDAMTLDNDLDESKNRGSAAVEERIEKLWAEMQEQTTNTANGADDTMAEDDSKTRAALEAKKVRGLRFVQFWYQSDLYTPTSEF